MAKPYTYTWLPKTGNEYAIVGTQSTTTGVSILANTPTVLPINSNIQTVLQQPPTYPGFVPLAPYANNGLSTQPGAQAYYHGYTFQSNPPRDNGNANVYRSLIIYSDTAVGNITSITINGVSVTSHYISGGDPFTKNPDVLTLTNPINSDPSDENVTPALIATIPNSVGQTVNYYKTINYIVIQATVDCNIWVGFGENGITDPCMLDVDRAVFNTSAQMYVQDASNTFNAGYTVWQTASNIISPESSSGSQPFYFNPITCFFYGNSQIAATQADPTEGNNGNLINNNKSSWDTSAAPMVAIFAEIVGSREETLTFTVLQEGIL